MPTPGKTVKCYFAPDKAYDEVEADCVDDSMVAQRAFYAACTRSDTRQGRRIKLCTDHVN